MSTVEGDGPHLPADRSLPPGQRLVAEAPIMHYGPLPKPTSRPWTFTIGGATTDGDSHEFGLDQVLALPPVEVTADMHCGTHWSVLDQEWSGVSAAAAVDLAPPAANVRWVLVFAEFGYAANVRLDDLTGPRSLLATHAFGAPLSLERGAPLRLILPQLYTWKGPKWVRGWNYLAPDSEELGFWEGRGYHARGVAWREQRYQYQE